MQGGIDSHNRFGSGTPSSGKYSMACKCGWKGELASSASDRCPRCSNRLRLAQSESKAIMRDAVTKALAPSKPVEPMVIYRSLRDKDAPIDEGEWEFKLSNGVLEVIAWNDAKTEAQCIRLVRRGVEIHQMRTKQESSDDAE